MAARRGRILGVMAVGIDRFKRVGEIHGPGAGDAILIESAGRLARSFRIDDVVARSGGDVFLVLLSDVKRPRGREGDHRQVPTRLRPLFFNRRNRDRPIGLIRSRAVSPQTATRPETLIRASEAALQLSKDDGPGSYRLYDAALHARLIANSRIEHELRGALRAEAFLPWFQPKVDILGRIVGVEALARWRLPEGGMRQPSEFIGAAERSGFIGELGRIVLAKACASAASWEKKGLSPIPVSVNLSPFQFRSDSIVKDVRAILIRHRPLGLAARPRDHGKRDHGGRGGRDRKAGRAQGARMLDIHRRFRDWLLLLCDLARLPRRLRQAAPILRRASALRSRATTIAGAVIDLAHRLRFSVVAEGVENAGQFAWLGEARCDQYQGFLFARPMPEEELRDCACGASARP